MELGDGNSGSVNEEMKVEEGQQCDKVEQMSKLEEESLKPQKAKSDQVEKIEEKKVEEGQECDKVEEITKLEEGQECDKVEEITKLEEEIFKPQESKSDQVEKTEDEELEGGQECDKVEEMTKLNEESVKLQEAKSDQLEKTKGKGLKKWKRRKRDSNKDYGQVQEPHRMLMKRVAPLDTSKGASTSGGNNKVKNEAIEPVSPIGNNFVAPSVKGFGQSDRESDTGSWNAVASMFPAGYSEEQSSKSITGASLPKGMLESFVAEDFLNEFEIGLVEPKEEMNFHYDYGVGIETPPSLRAFGGGSGNGKRPAGPTKKARAEKFEGGSTKSEDPTHEYEDCSISTGRSGQKLEVTSAKYSEDVPAENILGVSCSDTCVSGGEKEGNLDDLGESSCSNANNLGSLNVNASDHRKAVTANSGSHSIGEHKEENLDEPGESSCSDANNLGSTTFNDSGESKVVMAKSGGIVGFGNRSWTLDELALWYENFDPENSTFERENNEGAEILESDERVSANHIGFREGGEVREIPVLHFGDVAQSEASSFASAATVDARKSDETWDSALRAEKMHLHSGGSDCLVQALTQLQTAEEGLNQEVQHWKDLGKELESSLQMKDFEQSNSQSHIESNRLHKFDVPYMPNGSHVEENAEIKWPSVENQLNKLIEKRKLLQEELEAANDKILSEQTKAKDLEVQCKNQEIKLKEAKLPSERTTNDMQFLEEKCREMERELEEQLKEKWQAEMEFVILKDAVKSKIALAEKETSLLQEQKALVIEQLQTTLKLKKAKGRALSLKDHLIELENASSGLLEMEEVLTLHNKVCSFSLFSFIQFILLCVAIFYVSTESPQARDLVPT